MAVSRLASNAARYASYAARAQAAQAISGARSAAGVGYASARETARINSYPQPTDVLTASDAGTDATIAIADHSRIYPVQGSIDVADVALAGLADLTGLAYGTTYFAYYDDLTLADTAPTVLVTTDIRVAQVGAAPGRHFLGSITTPASGGGSTTGDGGTPPGSPRQPLP